MNLQFLSWRHKPSYWLSGTWQGPEARNLTLQLASFPAAPLPTLLGEHPFWGLLWFGFYTGVSRWGEEGWLFGTVWSWGQTTPCGQPPHHPHLRGCLQILGHSTPMSQRGWFLSRPHLFSPTIHISRQVNKRQNPTITNVLWNMFHASKYIPYVFCWYYKIIRKNFMSSSWAAHYAHIQMYPQMPEF